LKPIPKGHHDSKTGFFGWFNRTFEKSRNKYHNGVHHVIKRSGRWLVIYLIVIVAVGLLFARLPKSFLPDEDQGMMFALVQTPAGSTQEITARVLDDVSNYLLTDEKDSVESVFQVNGFNFSGRGQNSGIVFIRLKDYTQRSRADQKVQAIVGRMRAKFGAYKNATVFPVNPPSIPELGTAAGFDLELQDRAGLGHDQLMQARIKLLQMASQDPGLMLVRPNGLNDTQQFKIDIDREKANMLGVTAAAIDQTFSIAWASQYVNNFLDVDGRIKKVYVMADAPYRMTPEDLNRWYVRNAAGDMVPFSAFASGQWIYGSPKLERYNSISAMEIQGSAAPGRSTGQAMAAMEAHVAKLPPGIGYEWTGLSLQERQSGSQAPILCGIAVLVVFLCLAALYESWSIPFSVIMVVPLGILGALLAVTMRGLENDVFFQVGLLTTVGLSAKNAILIVEFARNLQAENKIGPIEAVLEAARLRLRPIVMTSMAFVMGVLPLVISSGAGSGSQHSIGTGVVGGMLTATFLAIFMIPMFFVVVRAKFAHETENVDEALAHYDQHHAHDSDYLEDEAGSDRGNGSGSTNDSAREGH
ncbi:MAG: efflux RND transporter permease subunit, partial [Gallionellaceae bacterium]|nr:efflux RND transporter permease subunit [Gallionellaceae bacterium]